MKLFNKKLKTESWEKGFAAIIFLTLIVMLGPLLQTGWCSDEPTSGIEERIKAMENEIQKLRQEADVRKKLEPTETEEKGDEEEILSAAGRKYTLIKPNTLGLEYRLNYSYNSYDIIDQIASIEQISNHTITNSFFVEYGLIDNVSLNFNMPFVYKYDRTGTSQENSSTDIGDLSFGASYQPFKTGGKFPTTILFGSMSLPSGRSLYEIDSTNELATGSGVYAISGGASFSKNIDPVVGYGSVSLNYPLPVTGLNQNRGNAVLTEVDPGASLSVNIGMAYSISYNVSMNIGYSYTHRMATDYTWQNSTVTSSGTATSSTFSVGTGWRISPSKSVSLKLSMGLTSNDPDFSFSLRLPFNFDLSKKKK